MSRSSRQVLTAVCILCVASLLSAAACRGESKHVFGIHSWDWGADLDVMSWHTGWDVEANLADGSPNVGGRYAPACAEGFTIIQRLDYSWEYTIPPDPALYPQFAQDCAQNWARNLKRYCRYYLIGNEIDFDFTPAQYVPCFEQVRDAIKAEQPDARVIVGHWNSNGNVRSVLQLLGPGGYDGVTCHTGSTVPTDLLNMLDEEGAPPHVGVYISEWGWVAGTNPNAAQVMLGFYNDLGNWNATHARQVYCACWYLYPSWLGSTFSLESSPIDNAAFEACTALGTAMNSYSANPIIVSDRRVEVSTSSPDLQVRWHTNLPSRTQLWFWQQGWNNGEFRPLDSTLVYDHSITMGGDPPHILPETEYTIVCRSTANDCGDADEGPIQATTGPWTITVSNVTGSTATISWQTLFPATSRVDYGISSGYGYTASDSSLVTNHVIELQGLLPMRTYHFQVRSEASGYAAHHSADQTFTTGSISTVQTPPGFCTPGWNLTSVPLTPSDPEASAVFQDLVDLGNVITNNLYRYDAGIGYAIYPASFSYVDRGRGYWLWLATAEPSTVVSVAGHLATTDVQLGLGAGWNLIGHPHPQAVPLSDCQVTDGATTLSFNTAVGAGWVAGTLYYWEPGVGYRLLNTAAYGHDDTLRPWWGYWINALGTGLSLIVPRP